jgi:hypothetical protein
VQFVEGPDALQLRGLIERTATGWAAQWWLSTPGAEVGERHLHSSNHDCRDLDDAVVLVAALMLEPWLRQEAAPVVPAAKPPRPLREEKAPTAGPVPPRSAERAHYELAASFAAAWHGLPEPAWGFDVALSTTPLRALRLELGGAFFPARTFVFPGDSRAQIAFGYSRADLCPGIVKGAVRLEACVGVELGALRAEADGSESIEATARRRLLFGGHGAARVQCALARRVSIRTGLTVTRSAAHDRFGIEEPRARFRVLYETPQLAWSLLTGLAVSLR